MSIEVTAPRVRPDIIREPSNAGAFGVVEKPLSGLGAPRATSARCASSCCSSLLALVWEIYARWLNNPLLFPTFSATVEAFAEGIFERRAARPRRWTSLRVLLIGYAIGIALRGAADGRRDLVAHRHRPAGAADVDVQSAAGDRAAAARADLVRAGLRQHRVRASSTRCCGRSRSTRIPASCRCRTRCGWSAATTGSPGSATSRGILIPAAFPSILTGLKIGWAFAWRTLIAAELVFGVSSGSGGLGWFIYENKNQLDIPNVFAGLFTRDPDRPRRRERHLPQHRARTVRRWGMQS